MRYRRDSGLLALTLLTAAVPAGAQSPRPAPSPTLPVARPTLDTVRRAMAVPSHDDVRGRIDSTGYALHASQMAKVWELSASLPAPDSLGPSPAAGVAMVICPHDDFSFAGRVYRRVLPLITARTVILIGVFHGYRRFGEHDRIIFDPYREWTAPDGPVPVASLREALIARMPHEDWTQDATAHDAEHSLEPLVCWLRHVRPDLEIVPIIVPASHFDRLKSLADHLGAALEAEMASRHWQLGRDVAIAISADAIHYGPDFKQTVFGAGGLEAYQQAVAKDHGLLEGPLSGALTIENIRTLYGTFVDPDHPDDYRWTWCGRFSVPLRPAHAGAARAGIGRRHRASCGLRDLGGLAGAGTARHPNGAYLALQPVSLRRLPRRRVHGRRPGAVAALRGNPRRGIAVEGRVTSARCSQPSPGVCT